MLTKSSLQKDHSDFTMEFSMWFEQKYRISFEIFDDGALSDHIMCLNEFLGLRTEFYHGHDFSKEVSVTRNQIVRYESALHDMENMVTFEQMMRTMPQEECFDEFLKGKREDFKITLKDALRRIREEKQDEPPPKSQNAPISEKIDTFWDKTKTIEETPF